MEYGPNTTYLRAFERAYASRWTRGAEWLRGALRRREVFFGAALAPVIPIGLLASWGAALAALAAGVTLLLGIGRGLDAWLGRQAQHAAAVVRTSR